MAKFYYFDGSVETYLDQSGKRRLHRLDGSAIEWDGKTKSWYINGKHLTEENFEKHILVMKLSGLLDG